MVQVDRRIEGANDVGLNCTKRVAIIERSDRDAKVGSHPLRHPEIARSVESSSADRLQLKRVEEQA